MTKFLNNADIKGYIAQTAVTSYLLKADSTGRLVAAIVGTDYQAPTTALLPAGGTAGQILAKIDGTNYNTQWIDNYTPQVKHDVKLGAALSKGTPVYVSSANGTNMIVSAASNASEATSSKTLGLLESGGILNDTVKVVTEGLLAGLNTSTATAGDPVWLGPSGTLLYGLANKPVAPVHMVFIGIVTRVQSVNGEIFVKVQNGFELDELHNVALSSSANNEGLFYDSATNLWKNKTIAAVLGYTPANGANYLPLSGGTLTGDLTLSGTNPRLYFTDTDNNPDYFISNTDGTFTVYDVTNSVGRFKIYSGGNAEFTGSVTTNSTFNITNGLTLFGNHISTQWYNGADTVFVNYVGYNGGTTQFRNFHIYDGKQGVVAMFDGSTKIATFSSSVTATGVTAKSAGNYGGFIADNSSSATIGGGYFAAYSFGVQRALFGVAGAISGSTDNNAGIFAEGGLGIKFFVNGSGTASHMMTSAGSLGIGTTSPADKLHVHYGSGLAASIRIESSASGQNSSIIYVSGGVNRWEVGTGISSSTSYEIYDRANSASRFRLSVAGQFQFLAYTSATSFSGTAAGYLAFDSSGNVITVAGVAATDDTKLPLTGGALTGPLTITGNGSYLGDWGYKTLELNDTSGYAGIFFKNGANIWINRRNGADNAMDWAYSTNATAQGTGTFTQKMRLASDEWWVSTYPNYKMRIVGGDVIESLNGTSATTLYLQYHSNTGGNVNIAASKFIFYNTGELSLSGGSSSGQSTLASGLVSLRFPNQYSSGYTDAGVKLYIFNSGSTIQGFTAGPAYDLQYHSSGSDSGRHAFYVANSEIIRFNKTNVAIYGALQMATSGTSYIRMGQFPQSTSNSGETWIGRAADRSAGSMTVQLGGSSNASFFEIVDYAWTTVTLRAGMNDFSYKGNAILHAGNYNSYSPTLTGGNASGTWGINITGKSETVTINYNNDSNSTYQLLWGSGNSVYGTSQVYVNPSSDVIYARGGYISPSNPWGTSDSAYFPNGITTAGSRNWIYGATYIGNAPGNGQGVDIGASGNAYFRSNVGTSSHGSSGRFHEIQSAAGNFIPYSFENEYGNHSWGIVARFRINQSGADRPSIQFSAAGGDDRWNVGYCTSSDWNFRITQNMAYRNDNSTTDSWGTERFRINTSGDTYAAIGGTLYANGNQVLTYAGGTLSNNYTFRSNLGGYLGSLSSPPLQVYSESNNSAFMSFHKGGYYAVNFGLDADNVMRIGGWSASANRWQLDMSGNQTVAGSMYATGGYFYGSGSIRCGDMWGGAGLYRPSGDMVFGTEAANWVFSSQANTRAYFASGDGNLWMQWSGEFLSTTLGRKHQDGANPSYGAVYSSNWFRAYGDCGLYTQDYGGHFRRNTYSYGTWETFGYNKNGYGGIVVNNNYVTAQMHNSSGDYGFLTENGNWWNLFYNNGNNCWGIGTDNTYSGDGFRCIKYGSAQYGWTTWSDRRAKENISGITGALDIVLAMRGVYFNYIQDEAKNKRVGFIAQELEGVLPEAVRYAEEIDEYSVEYAQIVSVLAEAIKEQNIKIQGLEAQLQTLLN